MAATRESRRFFFFSVDHDAVYDPMNCNQVGTVFPSHRKIEGL